MDKKKDSIISPSDCSCPLGSLTVLSRKIGKIFRNHFYKLNVSNSQVYIFLLLSKKEEVSQSEIGKILELERSTVSRDLVRLIDKGYLYKVKSGVSPIIGLTKKGQEFSKKIVHEWEKGYQESTDLLGKKGMEALKELEQQILKN